MMIDLCQTFLESGQFPEDKILNVYKPDGVTSDPLQLADGLFAFQLALTMNIANISQFSIDQIGVCFKLIHFFQSHLHHITDIKLLQERNAEALSVFKQVRDQTLHNSQGSLGIAMTIFKQLGKSVDSVDFKKLRNVGDVIKAVAIASNSDLENALAFEPLQHEDSISNRGTSLAKEFNNGQVGLMSTMDRTLGVMLARRKYIQDVVVPSAPSAKTGWDEDLRHNIRFMHALIGWQSIFSQISNHNNEFMRSMTP